MCLLSAPTPNTGGGANPTNPTKNFTTATEYSVHSPESPSSSSDSSSNPSPPQLSPQILNSCTNKESPIYLDLNNKNNKENEEPLVSPPMALLTPQLPKNEQIILTEEPKVVTIEDIPEDTPKDISGYILEETISEIILKDIPERKKVPFTFCDMRPNILDLKKKRGRKPNMNKPSCSNKSKEWKKNNFHPEIITIDSDDEEEEIIYKPKQKRKYPRAESIDDPYNICSKSQKIESQNNDIPIRRRRASAHPELKVTELSNNDFEDEIATHSYSLGGTVTSGIRSSRSSTSGTITLSTTSDSDSEDLLLQIDDEEDEQNEDHESKNTEAIDESKIDSQELVKSVISSIIKRTFKIQRVDLGVPLIDVFQNTPLNNFKCTGCTKSYSNHDSIIVDLKCQIMSVTCSQCSWWTKRRIGVKKFEQKF